MGLRPDEPETRRSSRLPFVLLVLLATATFAPVLMWPFLDWDDLFMIVENQDLRLDRWRSILGYWDPRNPYIGLYIPLTYSVYFVLGAIGRLATGEMQPALFHAGNLGAHLAAGWLVWRLLHRLGVTGWPAVAGAGVFLLHPLQVEAVAWAASLNTVLAGALATGALLLYVRSARAGEGSTDRAGFIVAGVLFALALLAKPSVCGLPLAALAIDRLILASPWRPVARRVAVWVAIALPILIAGRIAQPARAVDVPLLWRPVVAMDAVGFYLTKLAWPVGLVADYGRTPARVMALTPSTVLCVGVTLLVAIVILRQRRRRPMLAAAAVVFVAGLAPVLGLLPFDFQAYSTVADRYAYPAMIGVAIAVGFVLGGHSQRTNAVITCVGLFACAILSAVQVQYWRSDAALFRHVLSVNPESYAAHGMLARIDKRASERVSEDAERRRVLQRSAIAHFEAALEIRPYDAAMRFQLASLLRAAGDPRRAAEQYEIASRAPGLWADARLHVHWGLALAETGRWGDALARLRRAVTLDPRSIEAHVQLATALARTGDRDGARQHFELALSLRPDEPAAIEGLRQLDANR